MTDLLFNEFPLAEWLGVRKLAMIEAIQKEGASIPRGSTQVSESAIAGEYAQRFRVELAKVVGDPRAEANPDNPDPVRFVLAVAGDVELLRCTSPDAQGRLEGTIRDSELSFVHSFPAFDAAEAKRWIREQVAEVDRRLAGFVPVIDAYNDALADAALAEVVEVKALVTKRRTFLNDLNAPDAEERAVD
jgi:hypothetical protein